MKKNGFTLIEMIAVILLITLLATTIIVNMTGIKSNQDESSATRFKMIIESAACTYVDMNENITNGKRDNCKVSGCNIALNELITQGLVEDDLKDKYTNKTALEEKDDIYVYVHWENDGGYKVKKCEMKRK